MGKAGCRHIAQHEDVVPSRPVTTHAHHTREGGYPSSLPEWIPAPRLRGSRHYAVRALTKAVE